MIAAPEWLIVRPASGPLMIQRPAQRTELPDPAGTKAVDPLSAVLRAVRLRGAVFFLVDASPPWVAAAPAACDLAPAILPDAQHLIEYHVVRRGACFGGLVGERLIELGEGDVIVFPQGDPHVLSSSPDPRTLEGLGPEDVATLLRRSAPPFPIHVGGRGAVGAEVVCGFLGCDVRPFNPLIATLPRVLLVRADERNAHLNSLIALTFEEAAAPRSGGECVLARLSELLFIEVVRLHLQTLAPEQEGWLAGLRDPIVGRALALLHGEPARPWTLEGLARAASVSRSVLAERFKRLTGLAPMQYLTQWRMQVAATMLAEGDASVAAVAFGVGYGSEAAFSRAFKRALGASPAAWRQRGGGG